jgi:hypothetical protein
MMVWVIENGFSGCFFPCCSFLWFCRLFCVILAVVVRGFVVFRGLLKS